MNIRKMSEQERAEVQAKVLADKERAKPYQISSVWAPKHTPEEKAVHDAYVAEHKLPF